MMVCIPGLSISHEDATTTPVDTRVFPVDEGIIVSSIGVTPIDGEFPHAESENMRNMRGNILRRELIGRKIKEKYDLLLLPSSDSATTST